MWLVASVVEYNGTAEATKFIDDPNIYICFWIPSQAGNDMGFSVFSLLLIYKQSSFSSPSIALILNLC